MTPDQIHSEICAILDTFGISQVSLSRDTKLREDLDLDSIDLFDLLVILDKKHGLNLTLNDFNGSVTLGDVVDKIYHLSTISDVNATQKNRN